MLNSINGKIIGTIGNGNIINLKKCRIDWCLISINNHKGWVNKKNIWGVKEKEIIKISFLQKFQDLYWNSINSLENIINKF